jgi:hypothetical protein
MGTRFISAEIEEQSDGQSGEDAYETENLKRRSPFFYTTIPTVTIAMSAKWSVFCDRTRKAGKGRGMGGRK